MRFPIWTCPSCGDRIPLRNAATPRIVCACGHRAEGPLPTEGSRAMAPQLLELGLWACPSCGRAEYTDQPAGPAICENCGATVPEIRDFLLLGPRGVGTILSAKLAAWGFEKWPGCGCDKLARKLNRWGPEGCQVRRNRRWILDRIADQAQAWAEYHQKRPWPRWAVKIGGRRLLADSIREHIAEAGEASHVELSYL